MLVGYDHGLYIHEGTIGPSKLLASFDLDWTLIRPHHGKFPVHAEDWIWMPNRIEVLQYYQAHGYTLAIFSNQGYTGAKLTMALQRIQNIITALNSYGLNPWVFVATGKNEYRKPNSGMWSLVADFDFAHSFYCGDAAGRPTDFANSDLEFAATVGIPFFTPEEIFGA